MAKCEFCDKGVVFGIQVSHSHRRSNRPWKPNVKRVKAIVNGTPKHVYVCTHCLRSGQSYPRCLIQLRQKSTGLCLCFFLAHRCGLWYTVPIFQPETTKPAPFWLRTMEEEVLWHLSRQSN